MAAYQCLNCEQIEDGDEPCCDKQELFCINSMPSAVKRSRDGFNYIVDCFGAAMAEGLQEALAETTDLRLKDLVERRLMHALYKANECEINVVTY